MTNSELLFEKVVFENSEKGLQLRLTVSRFREVEYIHLRKYYLSFDEGYLPSQEGASMPMSIQNTYNLLDGLIELCSTRESLDSMIEHLDSKIQYLKDKLN